LKVVGYKPLQSEESPPLSLLKGYSIGRSLMEQVLPKVIVPSLAGVILGHAGLLQRVMANGRKPSLVCRTIQRDHAV
jgi:hypothetical protein